MEAENDTDNIKKIEQLIYQYPVALLQIKSQAILEAIDDYLPYSCGMEFECFKKDNHNDGDFDYIPNIMDVNTDTSEQRYRIPNGLKGMVCLYHICQLMKEQSALDLRSSNHYHFDMTDVWDLCNGTEVCHTNGFRSNVKPYIQEQLINWNTAKDLTKIESWYKFNDCKTLEIRIGEPTFDYPIIINRLIQGSKITKYLKDLLKSTEEEKKLLRLQEELKNLSNEEVKAISFPINDIKQQLKSRTNKI